MMLANLFSVFAILIFGKVAAISSTDSSEVIPKVFHQVWFDFGKGAGIPTQYVEQTKLLLALHPGWDYMFWDEKSAQVLIEKEFPEFLAIWLAYDESVKRHDSVRMLILHVYGGVYVDHDFLAIKNIEPLLEGQRFVVANQDAVIFDPSNGFMASTAKNFMCMDMLKIMNTPEKMKLEVVLATGPIILRQYLATANKELYKVYESKYFYPDHWTLEAKKFTKTADVVEKHPDCYLYHQFSYGWKK